MSMQDQFGHSDCDPSNDAYLCDQSCLFSHCFHGMVMHGGMVTQEQAGLGDCDPSNGGHLCDFQQGQQPVFSVPHLQSGAPAQGPAASQVSPVCLKQSCNHSFIHSLIHACMHSFHMFASPRIRYAQYLLASSSLMSRMRARSQSVHTPPCVSSCARGSWSDSK